MKSFSNGLKTVLLLGGIWVLLLVIGWLLASGTGSRLWLYIFGGLGLIQTAATYWFSDKLALRSMNAVEVTEAQAPAMYRIVRELSGKAGQPMPRLYIAPTPTPNAFATGRNPRHAAVCATEGILGMLTERELRGVLAHELMHVYNRDILISSVAAAAAGLITSISQIAMFSSGRRSSEDMSPLAGLALAIVSPVAAMFIQMGISRTREFDADYTGAQLAQDPLALASALKKISAGVEAAPLQPTPARENVAAMMIANPFGSHLRRFLSTHPPLEQRLARLEELAGYGNQ